MDIKVNDKRNVKAKELRIYCKVVDDFTASLHDENGGEIFAQEDGYVPGFMPGQHYGDYLILNIDLDTGLVTNWNEAKLSKLEAWVNGSDD